MIVVNIYIDNCRVYMCNLLDIYRVDGSKHNNEPVLVVQCPLFAGTKLRSEPDPPHSLEYLSLKTEW